jgi:RNA polymerase sigma factor (sigma-70 family)
MDESKTDGEAIAASLREPSAFGAVFERHYDAVHGYLQRRFDRLHADEIAAQTFLVAFEARRRFDQTRSDAGPWLFGIATNLARNHRRRELVELRRTAQMAPEGAAAFDGVEDRVDAERMRAPLAEALADLPTEESDVLLLLVWAELDQPEIADALSIPLGTVKSRLSRARRRVQGALALLPSADPTDNDPAAPGGARWTT